MRFPIKPDYHINELHLDEGNYRFRRAVDQVDCVKKIYSLNPSYFRGLMQSIAEDDLGEPILVYTNGDENVVADGNRRISALKVLYNDDYAPNTSISKFAEELRNANTIQFDRIQAQHSSDRSKIAKTVYERHSGGKNGTSRISWTAYAAARYGYDERVGENRDWRIIALLVNTEIRYKNATNFIESSKFSFEVYRRIIRSAFREGIISVEAFSESRKDIRKRGVSDLVNDALKKSKRILELLESSALGLSRKDGAYADPDNVKEFLSSFSLSPDNQRKFDAEGKESDDESDAGTPDDDSGPTDDGADTSDSIEPGEGGYDGPDEGIPDSKKGNGISASPILQGKLGVFGSKKLENLYYSLCVVSLVKHPSLMYVGAWSFVEVFSRVIGNQSDDFVSYLKNRAKSIGFTKEEVKDFGVALEDISKYGNATKHSKIVAPASAVQLDNDFETIEPLIVRLIDEYVATKH